MKVVVTNQVALNGGDAAILLGTLVVLAEAFGEHADIEVLDRQAAVAQRFYPAIRFRQTHRIGLVRRATRRFLGRFDPFALLSTRQRWLARCAEHSQLAARLLPRRARDNLRTYRSADLIVSAGGTYLVEHYHLEESLLQLTLAVASGKPVVLFTQSAGPFAKASNRETLAWLLPRISLALLRDERSRAHMIEAGLPIEKSDVVADAAFALVRPDTELRKPQRTARPGPAIAVSVRNWTFPGHSSPAAAEAAYRRTIAACVARLVDKHGASITFLSTCQGVREYGYDDSAFARSIVASLPTELAARVCVDDGFHTPEQLMTRLSGFDAVIATRMHMAILSLCVGTPVLPIAYEFKTKELFETLDLGGWVLDIGTLSPDTAVVHVDRFFAQLPGLRSQLTPRVIEQARSALSVAPRLAQLAERRPNAPQSPFLCKPSTTAGA